MKTVVLEGFLGDKYGRHWEIAGNSYKHIFGCIEANYPEFRQDLIDYYLAGGGLAILDGSDLVNDIEDLQYEIKADSLVISPIPEGSKSGGAKILLGALLIASLFLPGSSVLIGAYAAGSATGGALVGTAAGALLGGASLNLVGLAIVGLGINLALTGIQQLLAPDPSVDTNEQNYLFSGPQTTVASGNPVPILCGEMIIGGILMSSGIIPGTSFTYGHIGGVYTGGGPIAGLVGGLDGGFGGTLTGDIVGTITGGGGGGFDAVLESGLDGIEDDIILYSANTYSKPWVAKAPRTGISYISPVVPHEIPAASEIGHKKAIETSAFRQELLYDEDDVVVGTLPFNALLFKTLEGISLETLVDFGSDSLFIAFNNTLDTITIEAEADAAYIAVLNGTFEDSTLTSVSSYTAAAELAASLAATFDDATLASAALSDYIATLSITNDGIGISSEAISSSLVNEATLTITLDTIQLATGASSEYIATLASTLDDSTLSSVFNPEFALDASLTLDTIALTSVSTISTTRSTPVYRTVATAEGGGPSLINKPTGTVEGDLLVGFFIDDATGQTLNLPAGWTAIGTQFNDGIMHGILGYKIAGASEPSTYTWSITGSTTYPMAHIIRVDTFDASTPIGNTTFSTGNSNTRTIPAVDTTNSNSKILAFSAARTNSQGTVTGYTQISQYYGSNWTGQQDVASIGTVASATQSHAAVASWIAATVVINGLI